MSRGLGVQWPQSPSELHPGGVVPSKGAGLARPGVWRLEGGGQPGHPREGPSAALLGAGGSLSSRPRVQPCVDVGF